VRRCAPEALRALALLARLGDAMSHPHYYVVAVGPERKAWLAANGRTTDNFANARRWRTFKGAEISIPKAQRMFPETSYAVQKIYGEIDGRG